MGIAIEGGIDFVSADQVRAGAQQAGLDPATTDALVDDYSRAQLGSLKVGRGTEDGIDVGPLIDADQQSKVAELVDDAVQKGASVRVGGSKGDGAGYFYQPTVLGSVPGNTFSYYDQVLDTTAMVGAVPPRYGWTGGEIGFDVYFSMARGNAKNPAMEMTKWFDTN